MGRGVALIATVALVTVLASTAGSAHPARLVAQRTARPAGSLVQMMMRSQVGVVLDEIPPSMRARVAAALAARPSAFWIDRARAQLRLAIYRLTFRSAFYEKKQALPLPPIPVWHIRLVGMPHRYRLQGHDLVGVRYAFSSVLLSDVRSPGRSERKLAQIGGTWTEPFMFPVDPELLLQRTGFACMDEQDFPFGSVDSENVRFFYDQTAEPEKKLSNVGQYHSTRIVSESCAAALRRHVGRVDTGIVFKRLPWNPAVADRYRYGTVTGKAPDLATYVQDFLPSYTTYRYVHARNTGGCEVVEGSVTGTGWRRLLNFSTSDENVGETNLTIGAVDYTVLGHPAALDTHRLYVFSACHRHFHFRFYGKLSYDGTGHVIYAKKGFCLQSTARAANRETSPLVNSFDTCEYQGLTPGWIDQYQAGISGQWIDTTALPSGVGTRSFYSNPYGLLCEGTFVDRQGRPLAAGQQTVWAPTKFKTADGKTVEAPLCRLRPRWDKNNTHSVKATIEPQGQGLITTPCTRGLIGPLRNCGFGTHPTTADCVPGAKSTATFSIPAGAEPQVVRLTEFSHALNSPIPAWFEDSWVPLRPGVSDQPSMLATRIVTAAHPILVTFRCPPPRTGGVHEPGGTYSIYTAPVFPGDRAVAVARS